MVRYKKIPVEIDAIVWNGTNTNDVLRFCEGYASYELMSSGDGAIVITTLEDNFELKTRHAASIGDYIIKGVKDEFYPCKPDIFELTYEAVNNG